MKKKLYTIAIVSVLLLMLFPAQKSSAHSCTSYGELYGYWIDCNNHQATKNFTYYTVIGLDPTYVNYVINGATKWNNTGIFSITRSAVVTTNGSISTFSDPNGSVASFYNYSSNSSGHLTSWYIKMNTAIMGNRGAEQNNATMAHELGHAMGLNDLKLDGNIDKLMYGYSNRTATSPTEKDKIGANKILGN